MTPEDEIRRRFYAHKQKATTHDVGAARAALARSETRRAGVRRGVGVGALLATVVAVLFAAASLSPVEPDEIETAADTSTTFTTSTTVEPADDEPDVTTELDPVTGEPSSTAVVTVDADGVIRINETIWEPPLDKLDPPREKFEPVKVRAVAGASGMMLLETTGGVFRLDVDDLDGRPALQHLAPDARLLDVSDPRARSIIGWVIPEGNDPSGEVIGVRDIGLFPVEEYGDRLVGASLGGPGNDQLLLIVEAVEEACANRVFTDLDGRLIERVGCESGVAAWSEAGFIVTAASGEQDDWTIRVTGNGVDRETTFPGAFQPQQIDVITTADGRTEAIILGTGEELVYVDVLLFASVDDPKSAVLGISNETNLVSARFVPGLPQHGFRAGVVSPDSRQLASSVVGVADDDVLNARSSPGTENPVVFTIAPNTTGVVQFGPSEQSDDGGRWVQIYNPVSGRDHDTGWVNAAFLEPVTVTDARHCIFNGPQDHYIGIDWRSDQAGRTDSNATIVGDMTTYRFGGCIRTVIDLDSDFSGEGARRPANHLPPDIVVTRQTPVHVDLGEYVFAAEVAESRFTEGGRRYEAFIVIDSDQGAGGDLYMPSDMVDVHFDADRARIVIDVADLGRADVGEAATLFSDEVVITDASVRADRFTITGLARPFEATLGVAVRVGDEPVPVQFIGTLAELGDNLSETAVMTTAWAEGWGRFEFSMLLDENEVHGLIIDFDPSGGAADEPTLVSVPLDDLTE